MKVLITIISLLFTTSAFAQAEGEGWYTQKTGSTAGIADVWFINRDTGWAGTLWTTNGGETWATYQDDRYVIQFVNSKHGWSYGKTIDNGIARTTDGGKTWVESPTGRTDKRYAVFFCDSLHGYNSFYQEISQTDDGGKKWHLGPSHVGAINAFACFDSTHVLATGDLYPSEEPPIENVASLIYTSDGGENWIRLNHIRTKWEFADAFASDSTTVFGVARRIYRSKNRGWEWKIDSIPKGNVQDPYLLAVHFSNASNGTCVGTSGVIIRTTDGGESWHHQNSNTSFTLDDVYFVDSTYGWACGDGGTIIHTTDGGKLWTRQYLPKPLTTSVSPEPFGRKTSITYALPSAMKVKIRIYDVMGKELEVLESPGIQDAGTHSIEFDGSRYPEGTFHYRIETDGFYGTGKMTKVVY